MGDRPGAEPLNCRPLVDQAHDHGLSLVDEAHAALFVTPIAVELGTTAVNLPVDRALMLTAQMTLANLRALQLVRVAFDVLNQLPLVGGVHRLGDEDQLYTMALALLRDDGEVDGVAREAIRRIAHEGRKPSCLHIFPV